MSDDLVERVARAIRHWYSDDAPVTDRPSMVAARAAIAVVLEEAAKVALEQRCERGTPWDSACVNAAAAIRAMVKE